MNERGHPHWRGLHMYCRDISPPRGLPQGYAPTIEGSAFKTCVEKLDLILESQRILSEVLVLMGNTPHEVALSFGLSPFAMEIGLYLEEFMR